jgi:epoxyqueuosine reductase
VRRPHAHDDLPGSIKTWAKELGFADAGIARVALDDDLVHLRRWLDQGFNGDMTYMGRNLELRAEPARLQPKTVSVISVRMNYRAASADARRNLRDGTRAYISRYALGRDYHKLVRSRMRQLARRIEGVAGPLGYRVFADSAPVLEKALARNARLGWIGKNTLLLNRRAGSWFFLGEIFTDLPLAPAAGAAPRNHCGSCRACLDVCPTQAIVAPYSLDARRCISYLTIEQRGAIPIALRSAIGNRIFGCDDCQLVCPWNKYAQISSEPDFAPRHGLDTARLVDLFGWSEAQWSAKTEGMALRRAGYEGWLRNVAVALGNAPPSNEVRAALAARASHASELVREHVAWALEQQRTKAVA